jgi:hypothetical protein
MTPRQIRSLANTITDDLFSDGDGRQAIQLVLEMLDKRPGGGWGRASVMSRVAAHITTALGDKPKPEKAR